MPALLITELGSDGGNGAGDAALHANVHRDMRVALVAERGFSAAAADDLVSGLRVVLRQKQPQASRRAGDDRDRIAHADGPESCETM
jgi:hypothetical protein